MMEFEIFLIFMLIYGTQIEINASKDKQKINENAKQSRNVRQKSIVFKKSGVQQSENPFISGIDYQPEQGSTSRTKSGQIPQLQSLQSDSTSSEYDIGSLSNNIQSKDAIGGNSYMPGESSYLGYNSWTNNEGSSSSNPNLEQVYFNVPNVDPTPQYDIDELDFVNDILDFNEPADYRQAIAYQIDDSWATIYINNNQDNDMTTRASSSKQNVQPVLDMNSNEVQKNKFKKVDPYVLNSANEILKIGQPQMKTKVQEHKLREVKRLAQCNECSRQLYLNLVNTKCDRCKHYFCNQCFEKTHPEDGVPQPQQLDEIKLLCRFCKKVLPKEEKILFSHPCADNVENTLYFTCCICPYVDKRRYHIEKHLRTHTGEAPYPCTKCEYKAKDVSNLYKHYQRMHKKKNNVTPK